MWQLLLAFPAPKDMYISHFLLWKYAKGQTTNKRHAMTWLLECVQHRLLKLNRSIPLLQSLICLKSLMTTSWAPCKYSPGGCKVADPHGGVRLSLTAERGKAKLRSLLSERPLFWETKTLISCCNIEWFLPFSNLWQKRNSLSSSQKPQQRLLHYLYISLCVSHAKDSENNAELLMK